MIHLLTQCVKLNCFRYSNVGGGRFLCYNRPMSIRILAPDVVGKIAAGEVIERPASAVKELIENSLDAAAHEIRVEIGEGGRRLMRVVDDGCGIGRADIELATVRHATSKLRSADDLQRIDTLGFRGEALSSIAAVSQLTLLSRSADEPVGTLVRIEGGQLLTREGRGTPSGTVITVENLFYNVPARLAFLRQPATEAGHIAQIVARYALAFPERRFSLVTDGRLVFQSTGSGSLADALVKVYGLEVAQAMVPAGTADSDAGWSDDGDETHPPRVHGYVGLPSLHRANRQHVALFVNRRWIQDRSLAYAVTEAYHTYLPIGRYPVAVLLIDLDAALVDVNVHPTKAEVRFRHERAVYRAVQKAVREALNAHAPVPGVVLDTNPPAWAQPAQWGERRATLVGAGVVPDHQQVPLQFNATDPMTATAVQPAPQPVTAWGVAEPPLRSEALPMLRVVGQLGAMYILAEGPDGLYLIDQHAAHERILYEKLMAEQAHHQVASQSLLDPITFTPMSQYAGLLTEYAATLGGLGFALEPFGGTTYLVRAVPSVLHRSDPTQALQEVLEGLTQDEDLVGDEREARLVRVICKRAAIKGGQVLSLIEMRELVRQLEACSSPRTCPHGRPTMVLLSASQLEKFFNRR